MKSSTFKVEGMSCSHCEKAITEALNETAGVEHVTIDLNRKIVDVRYSESLNEEALISVIEDIGYDVIK